MQGSGCLDYRKTGEALTRAVMPLYGGDLYLTGPDLEPGGVDYRAVPSPGAPAHEHQDRRRNCPPGPGRCWWRRHDVSPSLEDFPISSDLCPPGPGRCWWRRHDVSPSLEDFPISSDLEISGGSSSLYLSSFAGPAISPKYTPGSSLGGGGGGSIEKVRITKFRIRQCVFQNK